LVGRNFKDFDAPSAMECSQLAPKLEGWCNDIWAIIEKKLQMGLRHTCILWGKHIAPKCWCCCQSNPSMTDLQLIARFRVHPKMSAKDKIHWKVDQIGQPRHFGVKRIHWNKYFTAKQDDNSCLPLKQSTAESH
jgi:hypothetical protein